MAKIDLPYTNDENTGFKDKLLKNKSGLTEGDILQAWVFRRLDIFRFKGENDIVESDLPAIRSELGVLNIQNYNTTKNLPNLPIWDKLTEVTEPEIIKRKKLYSRVGYPHSSKNNWASLSNNFNIYKKVVTNGDEVSYVKFPKSVKNNNLNTIISFSNIDIDFEGTYITTARSDISVKVKYTLDSFDLLDKWYDEDGKEQPSAVSTPEERKKYVRFLDLLTPPDIQKEESWTTTGILLEVYSNSPSSPNSYKDPDDGKGFNSPSFRNYLRTNLYIVDHTMTFDEVTNKVDIEIEYRAAADVPVHQMESEKNILYLPQDRQSITKGLEDLERSNNTGCSDDSDKASETLDQIEKITFKDICGHAEAYYHTLVGSDEEDQDVTKHPFYVRRYEYKNKTEVGDGDVSKKTRSAPELRDTGYAGRPYAAFPTTNAERRSLLWGFGGHLYSPTTQDYFIAQRMEENNSPKEHKADYYLSLHSLICAISSFQRNLDDEKSVPNQVLLPYIALGGYEGNGFYLGDLPINANVFDDWYNKRYVSANTYYADFKTIVKDVLNNYVTPHLNDAYYDRKEPISLNVSVKEISGLMKRNPIDSTRISYGAFQAGTSVSFEPSSDSESDGYGDWTIITAYAENGGDFLAAVGGESLSVGEALEDVSENYIVIEGKSAYGPFKNIKLSKNDSGYLREIRSVQQKITDIAQLGAVYDTTLETYPNCPDFRFFPGDMCFLYIPDFGLSTDKSNLAYKLGIGGHQIITKVSHKIDLTGTAKMTTTITMRYWGSGVVNNHIEVPEENCELEKPTVKPEAGTRFGDEVDDYQSGGF